MSLAQIGSISPFFIVSSVSESIDFYQRLGFALQHQQPEQTPFFAIVARDGVMLFLKSGSASPAPNSSRDPEMRWDAYCYAANPDVLAEEFAASSVVFSRTLMNTSDGLRGFEVKDPDGYVLFFGHPR